MDKHIIGLWSVMVGFMIKTFTWDSAQRAKLHEKIEKNKSDLQADVNKKEGEIYKILGSHYMPRKECDVQQKLLEERHKTLIERFDRLEGMIQRKL